MAKKVTSRASAFVYDLKKDRQKSAVANESSIKIGVFIDGTGTNAHNTDARVAYKAKYKNDKARAYEKYRGSNDENKDESSYSNDYSNVYRLYKSYTYDNQYKHRIYIEGIGTVYNEKEPIEFDRYGSDDFADGTGFGKGINGIRGKVFKACQQAVNYCTEDVTNITFDVFGFSRGAAAARNFVYEIFRPDGIDINMPLKFIYSDMMIDKIMYKKTSEYVFKGGFLGYLLNLKGHDVNKVTISIRFVGIFDTVASYDPVSRYPFFEKRLSRLHLNDSLNRAKKVIHLTSQYEHRKNFALTPVSSSIVQRREYCLPGVHTDIGGSYIDGAKEAKLVAKDLNSTDDLKKRKEWLVEQRFFREKDLIIDEKSFIQKMINSYPLIALYRTVKGEELEISNYLRSNRKSVCSRYDRIPLKLMIDYGNEYTLFNPISTQKWIKIEKGNLNLVENMRTEIKEKLYQIAFQYRLAQQKGGVDFAMSMLSLTYNIDQLILAMSDPAKVEKGGVNPDNDLLYYARQIIEREIKKTTKRSDSIFTYKTGKEITETAAFRESLQVLNSSTPGAVFASFPEEEILQQVVLRILRYRCFHWSASFNGIVEPHSPISNSPTSNGVRYIYNA